MRRHARLFTLAAAVLLAAVPARAQDSTARGAPPAGRDSMEARLRTRMAQVIQRQVGLSDDQMRRLAATNQRFEGQRRELLAREREVRLALRDEIAADDTTRQAQVGRLLDRMLQLQRQRLEMLEAEQREIATFMTPLQRARYFGLEEQLRRRMEEMRQQGGPRPGAPPPGAGPGRPGVRPGIRRPPPAP